MKYDYYKPEPRPASKRRFGQLNKFWRYRRRFGKHSEFIAMCYINERARHEAAK